ncbi:hypothetical protein LINGRAHAP2_LOCUS8757 [Linum grandiflorum]
MLYPKTKIEHLGSFHPLPKTKPTAIVGCISGHLLLSTETDHRRRTGNPIPISTIIRTHLAKIQKETPRERIEFEKMMRDESSLNTYNYGDALYWDARYVEEGGSFDWYQRYSSLRPFVRHYAPTSSPVLMVGCGNACN